MNRGDVVTLNDLGLRYKRAMGGSWGKSHVDWTGRQGTVDHLTRDKRHAVVRWIGNRSLDDAIPIRLLEVVQ